MVFPEIRMRERRKDAETRKRYRQIPGVACDDLIMPVFVKEGISVRQEIESMPGIYQLTVEEAAQHARTMYNAGIRGVILFGIPEHKDEAGSSAYRQSGIVQEAIRAIKKEAPGLCVIADVCLCEYTSHGHCGIIRRSACGHGPVDNDATIEILARVAVSYADAGADMVAPSAMMDGQVKAIKEALLRSDHPGTRIMSYSAKYASSFYAPFRQAAESSPQFADRMTYQMDYHNSDEALLEARLDIEEGADILMVKPALGYEDIIYRIKKECAFPLACYSVSGEYSLIKAGALNGYIDERKVVLEALTGFKRAGADMIITYYAAEVSQWLKEGQ
jgi:porphobilinogen synthase